MSTNQTSPVVGSTATPQGLLILVDEAGLPVTWPKTPADIGKGITAVSYTGQGITVESKRGSL